MVVNRTEASVCTKFDLSFCPYLVALLSSTCFNVCIRSPSVSANGNAEMFGGMTGFGWRSVYQNVLCVMSNQGAETCYDALESKGAWHDRFSRK